MQSKQKIYCLLALVFAFSLGVRLYFAFQSPTFTGGDAYFTIRQVEHIRQTGLPIFEDALSYGGRTYIFPPLFQYVLAFFNLFLPITIVGKLIPNIIASSIVFIVYLIAENITKNRTSAFFASVLAAFIPIYMSATTNTVSSYALVLPLMAYLVYCFLRIEEERYVYRYLGVLLIMILTHHSVVLWLLSLIVYLILIRLEGLPKNRKETEVIMFSIFFFVWLQVVIFKKLFLFHGPEVIWQNIPSSILANYFTSTSILTMITQIGTIPLLYGMYAISRYLFAIKDRKISLFIGFAFTVGLLLWFKLVQPSLGLMILGIVMTVLFSLFHQRTFDYIRKTRFERYRNIFFGVFLVTITSTSLVPALYHTKESVHSSVSSETMAALGWLQENTDDDTVILSSPPEGHLITSVAQRKDVVDTNYLLIAGIDQRYDDVKGIYTAHYETRAVKLLNKYGVNYLLFTPVTRREYGIEALRFIDNARCFKHVFGVNGTDIYRSLCKI